MIKSIVLLSIFWLACPSCNSTRNSGSIDGLTIDPGIKSEVERHIESSKQFDVFNDKMLVYLNSGFIESYENDSLIFRSTGDSSKVPFKSFYFWKGDTLKIDGAFGLFGGIGFDINIYKNKATLYHMLSSDESPSYSYNANDSLIFRLEVPCTDTKIILSEIPDPTKAQIIYGYIEFKSGNYFASAGSADGQEIMPRQKFKNNMKLYFKSGKLNL